MTERRPEAQPTPIAYSNACTISAAGIRAEASFTPKATMPVTRAVSSWMSRSTRRRTMVAGSASRGRRAGQHRLDIRARLGGGADASGIGVNRDSVGTRHRCRCKRGHYSVASVCCTLSSRRAFSCLG
jgi:hypothetical protein